MSLKCKFGFHTWDGCICSICGETRNEYHNWSEDCEKCSKCGITRKEHHNWLYDCEECSICGKSRQNAHNWDKYKCTKCGTKKEHKHIWENYKCKLCDELKELYEEFHVAIKNENFNEINNIFTLCLKNNQDINEICNSKYSHGASIIQEILDDYNYERLYPKQIKLNVIKILFEVFIKEGFDINEIRDNRYNQPLIARILSDKYPSELAKLAILAKADINSTSCTGRPVLEIACENGYKEIVELLISKGANVNPDSNDIPLLTAAKGGLAPSPNGGHKEIVDILINAGADVNAINEYGHTPLMMAASSNDVVIMKKLVSAGATIKTKDNFGRGAIFYATANNSIEAIEYLKNKGGGLIKPQKLQGILSFSQNDINEYDVQALHDNILEQQHKLGYLKDANSFKKFHVNAGDSVEDLPYIYAHVRAHFSNLSSKDVEKCYINDFKATDGNLGKYILIFDKPK